jgi:hypothetical protein
MGSEGEMMTEQTNAQVVQEERRRCEGCGREPAIVELHAEGETIYLGRACNEYMEEMLAQRCTA